jgi:hypothetical protein
MPRILGWLVSYRAAVRQTLHSFLHASQPPVATYSYNLLQPAALNRCLAAKRYIMLTKTKSVGRQAKATPLQTWTGLEVKALRVSRQSARVYGKVVSPKHWPPLPLTPEPRD